MKKISSGINGILSAVCLTAFILCGYFLGTVSGFEQLFAALTVFSGALFVYFIGSVIASESKRTSTAREVTGIHTPNKAA